MSPLALAFLAAALLAVANLPVLIHLLNQRKRRMLDFSKLQTAAGAISTDATALQAQAAASSDATNQAAIDAVTESLTSAHATLAALLPVPPVVEEPAPENTEVIQ